MDTLRFYNERLVSLDVFRGAVMLLLLAEGTNIYFLFNDVFSNVPILSSFFKQFFHAEWHGMHFWDLIQPYFTFIVGVAMAFSLKKRWGRGDSWLRTFKHILFRCFILFFLGIIIQSVYRDRLVWELWNILTQLSISILISFLIFRFPYLVQTFISLALLGITEALYRYFPINGFDQPFVKGHNFGSFLDLLLMGKTHPDGWVVFNSIPTTAHMIWGALAGNVLLSVETKTQQVRLFLVVGLVCLVIGYGLNFVGLSPLNKHISSSSFVIASGGWCFLSFLLIYWLVDIKNCRIGANFFVVVGANPIFIYVFSRTFGRGFLNNFVSMFTKDIMTVIGFSEGIINLTTSLLILGFEWYLCYWLFKRKFFIKI